MTKSAKIVSALLLLCLVNGKVWAEDEPDIFVHMETLRQFGMSELRPGQVVLVRYGEGPKGLMAAEIRPYSSSQIPVSH